MRALKMLGSDDCFRTAIACLLDCASPDEVPHVFQFDDDAGNGFETMRAFLVAQYGLGVVAYGVPGTMEPAELTDAFGTANPNQYYILIGANSRGVNHAVVCRGVSQMHDPAWGGAGIVAPGKEGNYSIIVLVPGSQIAAP